MQTMLQELNRVPGVIGTMLCDAEGSMLSDAFPPTFDQARLRKVAAVLVGRTGALGSSLGELGTLDLRYGSARVVVKSGPGVRLVFLCEPSANLALLGLTSADVLRRLAPSPGASPSAAPAAAPAAGPPAGQLYQAMQRINAALEHAGGNPFKLRGQIAVRSGLALELIEPGTPDDAGQLQKLCAAARDVLGRDI